MTTSYFQRLIDKNQLLNRQLVECAQQRDAALTEVERLNAEVQRLARELDHRDADPAWTKQPNWFAELREGL